MALTLPSRRELLEALETQILPAVENGNATLVPAHPVLAARVARVRSQNTPLLRSLRQGRKFIASSHWVEEGFNAARYPVFIWVAEGEADFRLGVTRHMVAHDKTLPAKQGSYIVALPSHSFFIVPPGMPFSDASRPHWERLSLADAHSRLLWFHVLPAGVSLHACQTRGDVHASTRALFLSDTKLLELAETLIEEMQNAAVHHIPLMRHYLAAFLWRVNRALSDNRTRLEEDRIPASHHEGMAESTAVQRACHYVETHFCEKLALRQIAAHAYVSPSHLNRLFRAELGQTIGEYLTQRRMEQARSLLETTDLPIQRVGVLCGYQHPEHFNRTFSKVTGTAPGAFRRRLRPAPIPK
jgi:AraC-like DNA-binding protein